jgi:hypothetical protein
VTWTGEHSFAQGISVTGSMYVDSSADFSQIAVDGSADISGALDCSVLSVDGSADFSSVYAAGDMSLGGYFEMDGTANFNDEMDVSEFNASGSMSFVAAEVTTDALAATLAVSQVYQVSSDGQITFIGKQSGGFDFAIIAVGDATDPATTGRTKDVQGTAQGGAEIGMSAIVKKNQYWSVVPSGLTTVDLFWQAFGKGTSTLI